MYFDSEAIGLEEVAGISFAPRPYTFDDRIVWRHVETGRLYTARDSGCSCSSPFEMYTALEDFDELWDTAALKEEAMAELEDNSYLTLADVQEFIAAVERAIQGK